MRVKAWEGDHARRLEARLRAIGYATATDFARARPGRPLKQLAQELGPDDVAAVQIEKRLYEEAVTAGAVDWFARDLLVRLMHEFVPEGWHVDWGPDVPGDTTSARWRGSRVRAKLAAALDAVPQFEPVAGKIMRALRDHAPFPDGWIPQDADDPLLVAFFGEHWRP